MRAESVLFAGVALFFAVTASVYGWLSHEPAGTAALIVSFLMSGMVSFFLASQYVRRGSRPQDHAEAEIAESAGPLDFFPPRSAFPALTAAGTALTTLGVVFGLWLLLVGVGTLTAGVIGFVFQYNDRGGA